MQIVSQMLCHYFTRHFHEFKLDLPMPPINRELLVNLTQSPLFVEDLLPESLRALIGVDLFAIDCPPTAPTGDDSPVKTSTARQLIPLCKAKFVLSATAHAPNYFAMEQAMLGLSGFTSTVRDLGETTRSMSSIGIAPNRTSFPMTIAPPKPTRFLKWISNGPT